MIERRVYQGIMQKGSGTASKLGFPTVNIPLTDDSLSGIYAARVYIEGEAPYMAAVYADQNRKILEAHLLDFDDDLSGMTITVELYEKLRESERFTNEVALRAAIAQDVEKTRAFFTSNYRL